MWSALMEIIYQGQERHSETNRLGRCWIDCVRRIYREGVVPPVFGLHSSPSWYITQSFTTTPCQPWTIYRKSLSGIAPPPRPQSKGGPARGKNTNKADSAVRKMAAGRKYRQDKKSLLNYVWHQWRTQEFFSGGVQQIQLRTEVREDGDLGAVAP